jgi:hypothetical protein
VLADADPDTATSRFAGLGAAPWPVDPGAAGLGTLLAISGLSLAVALLRREGARRRSAARLAGRLATLAGPKATLAGPSVAEREPSTIHSA